MSCENIQQYDFCTIKGDSVLDKEFIFNSFDETFDLKLEIYNQFDVKVETVTLFRDSPTKWIWKEYKESKKAGIYTYLLCYLKGTVERSALKGNITVKHHN